MKELIIRWMITHSATIFLFPLKGPLKVARHAYSLYVSKFDRLPGNIARSNKENTGKIRDNQRDTNESIGRKSAPLQSCVTWPHAQLDIKQSFQLAVENCYKTERQICEISYL